MPKQRYNPPNHRNRYYQPPPPLPLGQMLSTQTRKRAGILNEERYHCFAMKLTNGMKLVRRGGKNFPFELLIACHNCVIHRDYFAPRPRKNDFIVQTATTKNPSWQKGFQKLARVDQFCMKY